MNDQFYTKFKCAKCEKEVVITMAYYKARMKRARSGRLWCSRQCVADSMIQDRLDQIEKEKELLREQAQGE